MSNTYIGDYDGPSPVGIDWKGGTGNWGIAQYGSDSRAIVFFHKQSVYNEQKSIHAGRRVYDEMDFVSIQHPGEREQKIDRPVKPLEDPYRWPTQWAAFQKGKAQVAEGTPIDLLLPNNPGIADNLKSAGITTIEQLANLSATGMHNVGMGAQDYVNYARSYLEHAQKGVGFHQFQAEMKEKDAQIRILTQRVETLTSQIDQLLSRMQQAVAVPQQFAQPINVPANTIPQQAYSLPPLKTRMPGAVSSRSEVMKENWRKRREKAAKEALIAQADAEKAELTDGTD